MGCFCFRRRSLKLKRPPQGARRQPARRRGRRRPPPARSRL